ncbi:side tail fiber protein [Azorhizobium oxalatiphilum]|uniref:Side tail fiber protein n=1 Tax=Azorhizobium oxalatiphilum TaxID=980631 RepID=A0A917BRR5_9HYPH|nr:siderophore-interacting protein [Azorhizobium oxalatiphilum]GGF56277.1 side tail fiber protein [Azorhizobium oxalatiphilum]
MAEPALLCADALVPLPDPYGMLEKLAEHFETHGTVTRDTGRATITTTFGRAEMFAEATRLRFRVECPTAAALSVSKMVLSEHLAAFAGATPPDFIWQGDGMAETRLPYLHELHVKDAYQITPRMRRVIFSGDVSGLAAESIHVRLLIPPKDRTPRWPTPRPDGRVEWPKGEDALTPRVYTLRSVDVAKGEAAIDIVVHPGAPGSDWALAADADLPAALMGPGGGGLPDADFYLMAGDETALPAIARWLEIMPATARAVVRIEVADAAEEQHLPSRARVDLKWLHRKDAEAGTTTLLEDAVKAVSLPEDAADPYIWVGCEQSAARALRAHANTLDIPKKRRSIVAYWRRGYQGVDLGD